jgi:hypothetical protein
VPVGILVFYQVQLPLPMPSLQQFLSPYRRLHRVMQFVPNQLMNAVAARKSGNQAIAMLPYALNQI